MLTRPAAVAIAALLSIAQASAEGEVRVYNWSDYIDDSILSEFTEETGIKVIYDVFDSNEILETKLLAGGTGYDVVVPSSDFLARQIQAGVFQKLDKSKLTNLDNAWDVIEERVAAFDPDNAFSINYMWGTTGFGYNADKIKEIMPDAPITSWDMVFKPDVVSKFADCGVHIIDAPTELIPAVLNYLGIDPNTTDTDDINKAAQILETVRPYIQKFNSSEYINALANGDICLAVGWSGDVLQARDRASEANNGVTINYVIPKEGAQVWFDQMAIPADAPNLENAHTFINYMLRAEVAAKASNYVYYANGNSASKPLLNEDVIGDTGIYPDEETTAKLYTKTPYDAKTQRTVTRAWTRVKSGT